MGNAGALAPEDGYRISLPSIVRTMIDIDLYFILFYIILPSIDCCADFAGPANGTLETGKCLRRYSQTE